MFCYGCFIRMIRFVASLFGLLVDKLFVLLCLDCCDSDLRWLLGRELLVLWILVGLVWLGIVIDAAIGCWFLGV